MFNIHVHSNCSQEFDGKLNEDSETQREIKKARGKERKSEREQVKDGEKLMQTTSIFVWCCLEAINIHKYIQIATMEIGRGGADTQVIFFGIENFSINYAIFLNRHSQHHVHWPFTSHFRPRNTLKYLYLKWRMLKQ